MLTNRKLTNIGALTNKDDRHAAGDLFFNAKRKNNIATDLKADLNSYKTSLLLSISEGNESLNHINK